MTKPLLINWQDEFIQGDALVDEQHRAIIATINSFHYFLQQGLGIEALMPTVNILASYIAFHMKTEEGILRGAHYPDLDSYITMSNQLTDDFMATCQFAIDEKSTDGVLQFLKAWWQSHLEMHQNITPYIVNFTGQYCRID